MKCLFIVFVGCALVLTGCGEKSQDTEAGTNSQSSSGNPLTAPVDYLGGIVKAKQKADKTVLNVDTATLEQAIVTFQIEKGRAPKDLNEVVVGQFITRLPTVPEGMKLAYDPQTGKVSVVKK